MENWDKTGNIKYAIGNYTLALLLGVLAGFIGLVAEGLTQIALIILGVVLIVGGIKSWSETSVWHAIAYFVIGAVMIVFAFTLAGLQIMAIIGNIVSVAFIIFVGFLQKFKLNKPYGEGTKKYSAIRLFSKLTHYLIFFGGILLGVGMLLSLIFGGLGGVISNIAGIMCSCGCVCWILNTTFVLLALKEARKTINSYKN